MRRVVVTALYARSIDDLWADLVSYVALRAAEAGRLRYDGLPRGEARVDDAFSVRPSLLGIPLGMWRIRVVAREDDRRRLESEERGGVVRRWDHELILEETGEGLVRWTDRVALEAPLVGLVVRLARETYVRRPRVRGGRVEAARIVS